jgi:uncharacterized protein (DUF433 family)
MSELSLPNPTVVRTERGLSIRGTRITLYDVMDYLKAEWPPTLIQQWLNLTDAQMTGVLAYIRDHEADVEAEYAHVLQRAQEVRAYWEERNRDRLAYIASLPPKPGQEAVYAKIQARKAELGLE